MKSYTEIRMEFEDLVENIASKRPFWMYKMKSYTEIKEELEVITWMADIWKCAPKRYIGVKELREKYGFGKTRNTWIYKRFLGKLRNLGYLSSQTAQGGGYRPGPKYHKITKYYALIIKKLNLQSPCHELDDTINTLKGKIDDIRM